MSKLRFGTIAAIDPANARVRVRFEESDNLVSWWLAVLRPKSLQDRVYWMPDIGEQAACLVDEYTEDGVILGSLYSDADPPPASDPDLAVIQFADGTRIEHDRRRHVLKVEAAGDVIIRAAGQIKLADDAGDLRDVAGIGDRTICPAGVGRITSGSSKVRVGG